jgi:hypothetical protein
MNGWLYAWWMVNLIGLGMCISDHGKPRKPENALAAFVGLGINAVLLYMGGAFAD